MLHDFKESLEWSKTHATASWWLPCYKRAFPGLKSCVAIDDDGWAQRGGIDRVITLDSGKIITIDEKVRDKDYGDILIEIWSDKERKIKGWGIKPLACDFIAYGVVPTQKCYLLPTIIMQKALNDNKSDWYNKAKSQVDGFRLVDSKNRNYITHSIAIKTNILMSAISDSMVVEWSPE